MDTIGSSVYRNDEREADELLQSSRTTDEIDPEAKELVPTDRFEEERVMKEIVLHKREFLASLFPRSLNEEIPGTL